MARLIALDGRGAGKGLPVLYPVTYLGLGPDGRLRLAHGGEAPPLGAAIRERGRGGGAELVPLGRAPAGASGVGASAGAPGAAGILLNGVVPRGPAELRHGDVLALGGQTLVFDAEESGWVPPLPPPPAAPRGASASPSAPPVAARTPAGAPEPEADLGAEDDAATALASGDSILYRRPAYEGADEVTRGALAGAGAEAPGAPLGASALGPAVGPTAGSSAAGPAARSPLASAAPPASPASAATAPIAPEAVRLARLLRAAAALQGSLELEPTLEALLDQLFEAVGAERGAILLVDEARGKLYQAVARVRGRKAGGAPARVPVSRTIVKEAVRAREAILTANALADPRFRGGTDSIAAAGIRSAIVAPIIQGGRLLGVVQVDRIGDGRSFGRDDLDMAAAIAGIGAVAVDNARLHRELIERERLRQEVELATSVQRRLLPRKPPTADGLSVFGRMRPAKELGGDVFDFVPGEGGSLHIFVGDVSGKGIGAALIMAMARSYFRALIERERSPRAVVCELNRLLHRDTEPGKFMSAIHLYWDAAARVLRYCGAGQEHLIVRRAADGACEPIRAGGVALAVVPDATAFYEEKTLELAPGDQVLLYTDGATEARDADGAFFGLDRLVAATAEAGATAPSAEALVDAVEAAVGRFAGRGEAHDDLTLVALVRGPAPGA